MTPPTRGNASLQELVSRRAREFGCFLAAMAQKVRYGIHRLCAECGISEPHTFRAKLMKGIEVEYRIYTLIYTALKEKLQKRNTLENRFYLAQLRQGLERFYGYE